MQTEKRKATVSETVIGMIGLVVLPIIIFGNLHIKDLKKDYFSAGMQHGLENAEYYCNEFDEGYLGSYEYLKIHDPELYQKMSKELGVPEKKDDIPL